MKTQRYKLLLPLVGLVLWSAFVLTIRGESCGFGPRQGPDMPFSAIVPENEPLARVWLWRDDTNAATTVDYFTSDGPERFPAGAAEGGTHYVPTHGTVRFLQGESSTSFALPLIDNGLLDGPKDFTVHLMHAASGLSAAHVIRIEDNEVHGAIDPLFSPEIVRSGI